jgi:hypothetical protein
MPAEHHERCVPAHVRIIDERTLTRSSVSDAITGVFVMAAAVIGRSSDPIRREPRLRRSRGSTPQRKRG